MPIIHDSEFGEIVVRSHRAAKRITISVAPDGRLRASKPSFTPVLAVKAVIKTSRHDIRKLLEQRQSEKSYLKNQPIGKSHTLVIQEGAQTNSVELVGTKIMVNLSSAQISDPTVQEQIRKIVLKVLRKEAKSYLPRRLKYLAEEHGFSYEACRLTHASSRWGSCSSRGTISLNISLMQLPFELLDYVIIHELCHTREMNHSKRFWSEVSRIDPNYKAHRSALKKYSPNI